ncbi:MAG: hypothetical protein ACYC0B_11700 [Gemmatimonadaceae bacterium]
MSAQVGDAQQSPATPCSVVPATPPDSTPREYNTFADTIGGGDTFGGTVLRDIVVLQFRRGTSQSDKQTAICRVRGVVVGGRPLATGEGIYLVRIPGDRSIRALRRAIDALREVPHVLYVGPERVLTNLTPARTPPPRSHR